MRHRTSGANVVPVVCDIHHGMTLLEILVVLAIVSILLAITLPAILVARERACDIQCQNGMRQTTLVMHQIISDTGRLPEGSSGPWTKAILRYADSNSAADATKLSAIGRNLFTCPSDQALTPTGSEACNRGMNAETANKPLEAITDGTTSTILLGEIRSSFGMTWDQGPGIFAAALSSAHREKSNIGLCDGSVRSLSDSIDEDVLRSLFTPSAGEIAMEF